LFRRDDGMIDTRAHRPADAPTWPLSVRVLAVAYVLSYAVQPVAFLGLTGTAALLYDLGRPSRRAGAGPRDRRHPDRGRVWGVPE
jgi:hypothetical protein